MQQYNKTYNTNVLLFYDVIVERRSYHYKEKYIDMQWDSPTIYLGKAYPTNIKSYIDETNFNKPGIFKENLEPPPES